MPATPNAALAGRVPGSAIQQRPPFPPLRQPPRAPEHDCWWSQFHESNGAAGRSCRRRVLAEAGEHRAALARHRLYEQVEPRKPSRSQTFIAIFILKSTTGAECVSAPDEM